ncbi:MAG: hypothetical protein HQK79_21200 [Desulfobacterales bacterium]|nr:hypothetical protein [Desulfobacterales bacterium]
MSLVRDMLLYLPISSLTPHTDTLYCAIDMIGTNILPYMADRGISKEDLLTIDRESICFSKVPDCCRPLRIETSGMLVLSSDANGRTPILSWGGVHHGSSGYHSICALGNLATLANEFCGRKNIIFFVYSGNYDEYEQGLVPVVIALAKAVKARVAVYTILPLNIKEKHCERLYVRGCDRVEKWKNMTTVTAIDPLIEMKEKKLEKNITLERLFQYIYEQFAEKAINLAKFPLEKASDKKF